MLITDAKVKNIMAMNTVLIVDDDPTQVAILNAYFASLKAETIKGMTDPVMALDYAFKNVNKIDLIVCDLQMPVIDGLAFFRHLASINYNGKLAIISGVKSDLLDHASQLAKMHNLNFIGNLSKPITKTALDNVFLNVKSSTERTRFSEDFKITLDDYNYAIENNKIEPFFQPKIDVRTGKVVGAEALVRWKFDECKFISPEHLIEFVEQNGLIEKFTFYLFEKNIQSVKRFLEVDENQVFASNLPPALAKNINLPDKLTQLIAENNLRNKNFSFEITEDNFLNLDVTTLEVMSRLRILNFNVSIDDFGTGSSNIQTLRDFPYSELKIDRAFVSNATTNIFSQETIRAAVSLSHEKGIKIVAEGIEDVKTFEFIKAQGIDQAQGYLFSKALSCDEYIDYIKQHKHGVDLNNIANAA